ncbi:MAG TPA: helical backbone metal receptor [Thermoanaerobaculia bacterium]|nr:helical backbone metal receptor [Thermoanaerobaculia bacterium]
MERRRRSRRAHRWRRRLGALAAVAAIAAIAAIAPSGAATATPAHAGAPVAATARRIVSLAPSLTETLFALGLGDRVVGVDDYSVWPAAAAAKPRIGGLFNTNLEKIVTLRPDLALLLPSEHDVAAKLRGLGVASLIVPVETLADVERSFVAIARRCGVAPAGERLAASWRAELAPRPVPGGALAVMLSVGRQPGRLTGILAAARGTFLDELLVRLGAVNVFADAATRYPQVGLEEVVARAPRVILELRSDPTPPALTAALVHDWRQLPTVPAVRDGRIFVIAGDYVLVPGPRLPLLYRDLRQALLTAAAGAGARP